MTLRAAAPLFSYLTEAEYAANHEITKFDLSSFELSQEVISLRTVTFSLTVDFSYSW